MWLKILVKYFSLILILLALVPVVHGDGLGYQDRGDRWEGIAPRPVSGLDIELLSALVAHRETWQPLPELCKVKFWLSASSQVSLKVQELRPKYFYKMDHVLPQSSWQQGVNYFQWPTKDVIAPLDLNIAKLGAVARVQSTTNERVEHVTPVLLYHSSLPEKVNGYRFAFKVGDSANLEYEIYQESNRTLLFKESLGKQTVGIPFVILVDSTKMAEGMYKLVVKGYFLNDFRHVRQDVMFYHQPMIK